MKLKLMPPMPLNQAAAGVAVPKLESCGAPAMVSMRNASAMKMPPATTNGSMWETPSIRCLYTWRPTLSPSLEAAVASPAPPLWWYTGASPDSARLMSSSGLLMPSATFVMTQGLPSKRAISTFLSAATMMPSAAAISSAVSTFFAPPDPLVSTLMVTPIFSACWTNASAAM